jgi:2-succinyl-6-hydroxy-2,4-cyclohexadiene-1-carboxylate synthase
VIRLHMHDSGPRGGAAILWLHGFLGSGADFAPLAADMGPGLRHLAPDLPGHGATEATRLSDHAMPATAEALLAWLSAEGVTRPDVVGYSMGGRLALHLAATARDRFGSVVAVSATPGLADPAEAAQRRAADRRLACRLMTEPLPAFLDFWYAQPLFAGLDSASPRIAAMNERRLRQVPAGLARSLRAMGTGAMAPLWDALPGLSAPIDAIVGAEDAKFRAIGERMAASGRVRVHIVAGAGHAPHLEQPGRFVQTLQRVLQRNRT